MSRKRHSDLSSRADARLRREDADAPAARIEAPMTIAEMVTQLRTLPAPPAVELRDVEALPSREADTISRITALTALALGDPHDLAGAKAWLAKPNRALGGTAPIELLDTDEGVEIVERVIARPGGTEHDVYD